MGTFISPLTTNGPSWYKNLRKSLPQSKGFPYTAQGDSPVIESVVNFIGSIEASNAVSFFVRCFVSLFVIVNAIGNAPVFLTLLQTDL